MISQTLDGCLDRVENAGGSNVLELPRRPSLRVVRSGDVKTTS